MTVSLHHKRISDPIAIIQWNGAFMVSQRIIGHIARNEHNVIHIVLLVSIYTKRSTISRLGNSKVSHNFVRSA